MKKLHIIITDDQSETFSPIFSRQDDSTMRFSLCASVWGNLKIIESEHGFFQRLDIAKELVCCCCGSFSVSCEGLCHAIFSSFPENGPVFDDSSPLLTDYNYEILTEALSRIFEAISEEKLTNIDEWKKFQDSTLPELRLLRSTSGELVYKESGYPLGLLFDDVIFKLTEDCESCFQVFG